ncbi:hypothetical protein HDU67_009371 [Dinochytrium kinnereticum]|nr:hypothetical protein HDU67_009371 [Dinochytrium kinnereticum]
MALSVPSEEDMKKRLTGNGFNTDMSDQKQKMQELLDHLKYNAESSNPAWQVVTKPKDK